MTQYEVMHTENLMVNNSWWNDDYKLDEGYEEWNIEDPKFKSGDIVVCDGELLMTIDDVSLNEFGTWVYEGTVIDNDEYDVIEADEDNLSAI